MASPAGAESEQRRCGDRGDDGAEAVDDGPQNRAVRRGDAVDSLDGEAVGRLRLRCDLVDQAAGVVGQGAQLGDRGAVPDVVRLGDRVEHLKLDGAAQLVDDGLRAAPERLDGGELPLGPTGCFEAVGELPRDDPE